MNSQQLHLGYTLSCEELPPDELVQNARRAEEVGFPFAGISDHFHPWSEQQGQSAFVYSVIGAISQVTNQMEILVGVNCPIIRYHPAIIAQAAATCSLLLEGRFLLGIGAGENLNEHIVGLGWPPTPIRHEMLIEAIEIMQTLWTGELTNFYGNYYTVEGAKLYTHPHSPIPLIISAYGEHAARLAAKYGDGFISTAPNKQLVKEFEKNGGMGKRKFAQITVCYDQNIERAKKTAYEYWKFTGLPNPLNTELRLPQDFDSASQLVTIDTLAKSIVCGPDIHDYMQQIQTYISAGFTDIYLHQVGPNQEAFFTFAEEELLPAFEKKFNRQKSPVRTSSSIH